MDSIKLIASDLDGTLIPEGTNEIEPGFLEVIEQLLENGHRFYVASGRPLMGAEYLFENIKSEIGFICENGSLVIENGKVTFVDEIPLELSRAVCEMLLLDNRVDLLISGAKGHYIAPKTKWFEEELKRVFSSSCDIIKNFDDIKEPVIKIAMNVYDFDKNGNEMKAFLSEKFGDYADFVFTGNGWLDMILKKSGKGTALKYIMERDGLTANDILVFGDNENDVSMFRLTKNSYAKTNSRESVKAEASYVCDSVTEVLLKSDLLSK